MMKGLKMTLALLLCVGMLSGCGGNGADADSKATKDKDSAETTQSAQTAPATETAGLKMSWVGSYYTSNAMGDVVSGHLLNFYNNGTVKIYYGIKAGVQGHHYGVYDGTYSEDGTVKYSYRRESEDTQTEDEFKADFSGNMFQAKVFCMASYPNSGGGGIQYVRIDPMEPDLDAEYVYMGSKVDGENTYGAFVQLKDGVLTGSAVANGANGSFDGTYEIVYSDVTDIDTQDQLILSYAPLTVSADGIRSEGEAVQSNIDFNDPSYISYALMAAEDAFPRIPMAAIVNQDGSRNTK